MKILATSDLHGNLNKLNPTGHDVVVIAGDFAPINGFSKWHMHDQKKWIQKTFMKFVNSYPNIKFVIVPGNHDLCLDKNKTTIYPDIDYSIDWSPNACLLIDEKVEIDGVVFYGTPWIPIISYSWAFEVDTDKQMEMFAKIPENVDILVTHSPPHIPNSFIDRSTQYYISEAFGSNALATEIFNKKPKYVFCGHIHSGEHSMVNFDGTHIYNVSRVNEDYNIAYEPISLDINFL